MEDQAIGSSASAALRWLSPPHICWPLRDAFAPFGDASARLHRRLLFAERAARVLVALFSAEAAALGLEPPSSLLALLERMGRPSMGSFCAAATDLATRLEGRPGLVAPALARAFAREEDAGPLESAAAALLELTRVRNALAHGRAEDLERLGRECSPLFAVLLGGLRALAAHPIVAVTGLSGGGARRQASVVRFRGPDPEEMSLADVEPAIPCRVPLLVGEQGHTISLEPWFMLSFHDGRPELQLLGSADGPRSTWLRYAIGPEQPGPRVDPEALLGRGAAVAVGFTPGQAFTLNQRSGATDPGEIGGYRLLKRLGSGGSGRLFVASRAGDARPVALKLLHADLAAEETAIARMEREFRALRGVDRRDLVRVYEQGRDPVHGAYIAMELLEGQDLARIGRVEVPRAVRITLAVLDALEFLHGRGVVHRDIKPSNVVLRNGEEPVLIDLGIAAVAGPALTRTHEGLGTDRFAAPEQLRGEAADERADLYAAGRLLRALVAGDPDADIAMIGFPPGVHAVIARATSPSAQERYPSAAAMRDALRAALDSGAAGCPIFAGQRLGSLRVLQLAAEPAPGVWACAAENLASRARVGLLVALPGGPAARLAAWSAESSGFHLDIQDGLYVLVVPGGQELPVGRAIFSDTPVPDTPAPAAPVQAAPMQAAPVQAAPMQAAPESRAPTGATADPPPAPGSPAPPPRTPSVGAGAVPVLAATAAVLGGLALAGLSQASAKPTAPRPAAPPGPRRAPYLRGMPGPMQVDDMRVLAGMIHQLGLVLLAQSAATGERALTADQWLLVEGQPMAVTAAILLEREPSPGPVGAALRLIENRALGAGLARELASSATRTLRLTPAKVLAARKLAKSLGDAVVQVGPRAAPAGLAPYLREVDGGHWQYLTARFGSPNYVLLKPAFAFS